MHLPEMTCFMNLIPGHIYWKDTEQRYRGCNQAQAQALSLLQTTEIVGKTAYSKLPVEFKRYLESNDEQVLTTQQEKSFIEIGLRKNKELVYFISQKRAVINDAQQVLGIMGVSIPITDDFLWQICQVNYHQILSRRECEVLFYVLNGMSAKTISEVLSISRRTIETHVDNIKIKLNCPSKQALIRKILSLKIPTLVS